MLKRHLSFTLLPLLIGAVLMLSAPARAQTRVALVIGNSSYKTVANLANPAHDAQDVSEALKRLGFTVKTVIDADFDGFRRALVDFGRVAPRADMAVFYFAGHGVEINGNNWLLPTDVELKTDVDAGTEAIGLQSAMQAVTTAKTLGLVILDACRNNPFQSSIRKSYGATRRVQMLGLAPVEPADNVLVAYAARDGTVAADGAGRNSPYTAALLRHLETPGLEVDFLFRNVRDDVMAATNNEQQPFVYGSLSSSEIYFKPPTGVAADDPMPPDAAEIAWSFLRATNDISTLTRFVDRFPESSHVSDAKVRIASLVTAPAPGIKTDALPPPLTPVVAFADTEFARAEKAVARRFVRDTPAVEAAWDVIKESKDHTVIRHFVDRFPGKKRQVAADTHLAALGQKPITVHVTPPQLLDLDEAVLAQAAADPDVLQCFRLGDQTAAECQRAFERFPDIGHFAEDIRFTVGFCQAMVNPAGCVPTVKSTWNLPSSNPGSSPGGAGSVGPKADLPSVPDAGHGNIDGGKGYHTESYHHSGHGNLSGKHHFLGTGALKLQQGGGSHALTGGLKTTTLKTTTNIKTTTNVKTTNVKVTGLANTNIKTPTVNTPVVKPPTPNVKVNVRINIPQIHH